MIRTLIPFISGFGMSFLCPVSGKRLPQTPPKFVFPIVWSILYILIGVSWQRANVKKSSDIMHGVLVMLLVSWIVFYSCNNRKTIGLYILACIAAVTTCCIALHNDDISKILLTPLLAWILIAYSLNYNIIHEESLRITAE